MSDLNEKAEKVEAARQKVLRGALFNELREAGVLENALPEVTIFAIERAGLNDFFVDDTGRLRVTRGETGSGTVGEFVAAHRHKEHWFAPDPARQPAQPAAMTVGEFLDKSVSDMSTAEKIRRARRLGADGWARLVVAEAEAKVRGAKK